MNESLTHEVPMDPRELWQAGGAAALFIAGFGASGYYGFGTGQGHSFKELS